MMLDARSPEFRRLYPNYCHVYDARGRKIHCVIACNPETGEVIRCDTTDNGSLVLVTGPFRSLWRPSSREFAYFFLGIPWLRVFSSDLYNGGPRMRHGFWPAPLRVVPLGGPVPAGVPYMVGDGAREQRVKIINRITAATGKTVTRKLTIADLDELIDKVEDGAREQRDDIPSGGAGIAYLDELIDNAEGEE